MRVIPPEMTQPPENQKIPTNISLEAQALNKERMEIKQEQGELIPTNPNQIQPISKEEMVYKKREFKAFKKLIREGKYTSAIISSKLLGVDKGTILKWMHMPSVLQLQQSEVNQYVSDIAHSKDWKAKAYLLDKLEDKDKEKAHIDIQNLILVKR